MKLMITYQIEHEEAGCDGYDSPTVEGSKSICYRSHSMLSDTIMYIAPTVVAINTTYGFKGGLQHN